MQKNKIKFAILVIFILVSFSVALVSPRTLIQDSTQAISHQQIQALSLVYQPIDRGIDIRFSLDSYTWAD